MAYAEKRGPNRWRGRDKLPDGTWGSVTRDDNGQPFTTKNAAKNYGAGFETDVRRKTFIIPNGQHL